MDNSRILCVFDCDNTIIEGDSDEYVISDLLPQEKEKKLRDDLKTATWSELYDGLFRAVHSEGTTLPEIERSIKTMQPVEGMLEVLDFVEERRFDVIAASLGNTFLLNCFFDEHNISAISQLYCLPSKTDSGRLEISPFHTHNCNRCDRGKSGLCKSKVVESHSEINSPTKKIYFGDGVNDFCPLSSFGPEDLAFVRKGYPLENILKSGREAELQCEIIFFADGTDILSELRSRFS